MKTLKTEWTGIRPMVMHNGLMADPTNPLVREIKKITSKGSKKMTDDDYERRDQLEWLAGIYWNEDAGLVCPPENLERCIQVGAQKSRAGKDFAAAVFVSEEVVPIIHAHQGETQEQLYARPEYVLRKMVAVQKARIFRVRPMVPTGWKVRFTLEYDESIINERTITQAMKDAGALIGLNDWRPRFGRFLVEVL